MRNYKSLDAYKYFVDGWVLETSWKLYGDIFLLVGKVQHSYALRETPLKPWVAIKKNGMVECGHCTCMAGLAETCSHVAAILFWLETAIRVHEETTCTSKTNSWLPPSMPTARQKVPYTTMEELEKTAVQRKRSVTIPTQKWKEIANQAPTVQELEELYRDLSLATDRKPAILTLLPSYSVQFVQVSEHVPPLLLSLYEPANLDLNYVQLLDKVRDVCKEPVSETQVSHLEKLTRGQAKNRQWFRYRAGRITASQLHQVTHTNPNQPSLSLVRKVCYPHTHKFTSTATSFGCAHEREAIETYKTTMAEHTSISVTPCGLFVDQDASYLGASPDALVQCTCCGLGVVEVKCPLCAQGADTLEEVAERQKRFCLQRSQSGALQLIKNHPYYLQCQLQMHVTRRPYCDFVVWSAAGMHIECLKPDEVVLKCALTKAEQFFRRCILPELAGKWYTRSRTPLSSIQPDDIDEDDDGIWCFCKQSKGGDMVACDNHNCPIKWFHISCLEMTAVPSGKWLCPTCHPAIERPRKRRKVT